jgi:hypothetical protein
VRIDLGYGVACTTCMEWVADRLPLPHAVAYVYDDLNHVCPRCGSQTIAAFPLDVPDSVWSTREQAEARSNGLFALADRQHRLTNARAMLAAVARGFAAEVQHG